MKICIVVATPEKHVADYVSRKKSGIAPREFLDGISLSVSGFLAGQSSLEAFMMKAMQSADAAILIADTRMSGAVQPFRDALFLATFDSKFEGMIPTPVD